MSYNEMFRKTLFGGFNKADVEEHIRSLENEIESVKVLHQKEKQGLIKRAEESEEKAAEAQNTIRELEKEREELLAKVEQADEGKNQAAEACIKEAEGEIRRLQEALDAVRREAEQRQKQYEELQARGLDTRYEESRRECLELKEGYRKLREEKRLLEERNASLEEEKRLLQDSAQRLRAQQEEQKKGWVKLSEENEVLKEEHRRLSQENEALAQRCESLACEAEQPLQGARAGAPEDGFFDSSMVAKVLEDAARNADYIIAEARQQAEQMLEEAKAESQKQREMISAHVDAQLEEKGIQLIAAKYKIEQYIKEVNGVYQGLFNISSRMNRLLEAMPVRIDNYWKGEYYQMLERRGHGETDEEQEGAKAGEGSGGEKNEN